MDPRGVGFSTRLLCDVPLDKLTGLPTYDSRDMSPAAIATRQTVDSNTAWMDDLATTWEVMPMAFQSRWDRQFAPWANRNPVISRYLARRRHR